MKRFCLVALCFLLCFCFATSSCAQENPVAISFSLRNGYHWGMSIEDALELAKAEGLTLRYQDSGSLTFEDVPAMGSLAGLFQLDFMTSAGSEELQKMEYYFYPRSKAEAYPRLHEFQQALEKDYGPVGRVMDGTNPVRQEMIWELPETTLSLVFWPDEEPPDNPYALLYYNMNLCYERRSDASVPTPPSANTNSRNWTFSPSGELPFGLQWGMGIKEAEQAAKAMGLDQCVSMMSRLLYNGDMAVDGHPAMWLILTFEPEGADATLQRISTKTTSMRKADCDALYDELAAALTAVYGRKLGPPAVRIGKWSLPEASMMLHTSEDEDHPGAWFCYLSLEQIPKT